MPIQADGFVEQLAAKAVHDAHDDDQRRDAERHRSQTDRGDQEDEALALARKQVALGDHPLIAV